MDDVAQLLERNATVLDAKVIRQLGDFLFGQTDEAAQLLAKDIDKLGLWMVCTELNYAFNVNKMQQILPTRYERIRFGVEHLKMIPQVDAHAVYGRPDLVARAPHIVQSGVGGGHLVAVVLNHDRQNLRKKLVNFAYST